MPRKFKRGVKGKGKGKKEVESESKNEKNADNENLRTLELQNALGGAWIGAFPNGKSYAFFSAFAPHLMAFAGIEEDAWQMVKIDWHKPDFPDDGTVRRADKEFMYVDKWSAKLLGFYGDVPIIPNSRRVIYNPVSGKPLRMIVQYDLTKVEGEEGIRELAEMAMTTRESVLSALKASKEAADEYCHRVAKDQAEREKDVTHGVVDAMRNLQVQMKPSAVAKVKAGVPLSKDDFVMTLREEPAKDVNAAVDEAVRNAQSVYQNEQNKEKDKIANCKEAKVAKTGETSDATLRKQ